MTWSQLEDPQTGTCGCEGSKNFEHKPTRVGTSQEHLDERGKVLVVTSPG